MSKDKFEISGVVTKIDPVQEFPSGFKKREFILDTGGDYPEVLKFELLKDNTDKINESDLNHAFTVHFNVKGRAWEDKHFVNLTCWKLDKMGETPMSDATPIPNQTPQTELPKDKDDLPF